MFQVELREQRRFMKMDSTHNKNNNQKKKRTWNKEKKKKQKSCSFTNTKHRIHMCVVLRINLAFKRFIFHGKKKNERRREKQFEDNITVSIYFIRTARYTLASSHLIFFSHFSSRFFFFSLQTRALNISYTLCIHNSTA